MGARELHASLGHAKAADWGSGFIREAVLVAQTAPRAASYEVPTAYPQVPRLPASYDRPFSPPKRPRGPRRMKCRPHIRRFRGSQLHTTGRPSPECARKPRLYEVPAAYPQVPRLRVSYDSAFSPPRRPRGPRRMKCRRQTRRFRGPRLHTTDRLRRPDGPEGRVV